ncbi:signal peptide peptidase-domain-containing protein [Lasiosphaeria ovina]|uniref:Signal peptide peptidase-domain-containing protein n=1 Tax=Lasiosphaeria ovina TaxID=92902 RepID=A0AAE0TXW8_9PEZI|nr:signal peptide peptidase-domain-containing protein [Lasiosphaeria ovina]
MSSGNTTVDVTDGLSNSTHDAAPAPFALGMLAQPSFLLFEAQVILSALGIIWIGAHGSLRRPPSAAPAKRDVNGKKPKDDQFTEGFAASDAIMLPIMAGAVLIGLYYLIEWLQEPDILNRILRVYMSAISIASLGRPSMDALEILTSLVFPTIWADRSGRIYRIDPVRRCQFLTHPSEEDSEIPAEGKQTPFPGPLSNLRLSDRASQIVWEIRHLFTEEWTARLAVHGLINVNSNLKLNNLLGFVVSIGVAIVYYLTGWHVLSNLLGSAFSYTAFALMSPTSFVIGTMVLVGLFVYDIVMVFYTPFMIAVATKIDAPIKLVFQGTKGVSMLGLGDIVIPGLLIGLALRFDLHLSYQKRIKLEPVQLTSELTSSSPGETIKTTETQYRKVKALYVDSQSQWGNRFWTTKLGRASPIPAAGSATAATAFPKPYFYASMVGYALGMLLTLAMLLVSNHGQPALLYLVPGVTGSVWLTALVRGELKDIWEYTEDGSLDTKDVIVELDPNGKIVKQIDQKSPEDKKSAKAVEEAEGDTEKVKSVAERKTKTGDYEVFHFSITAPRHNAPKME